MGPNAAKHALVDMSIFINVSLHSKKNELIVSKSDNVTDIPEETKYGNLASEFRKTSIITSSQHRHEFRFLPM